MSALFRAYRWKPFTPGMAVGLLALVTVAVYWPVATHEFINYDDQLYVTDNRHVTPGLTWDGFVWSFSRIAGEGTYWHPLTWMSHMLDCELFGLNAGGHHVVNLLFHVANLVLLFLVLQRMTGSGWRSAVAAGLFALHPLQVDTVAWVAERKNVLSTLFGLLTMLAYAGYARRPGWGRYVGVVVLFALGLMAKPSLVTLPCVLLLLDYWPLGRAAHFAPPIATANLMPQFPASRLLLEKLPLFVFSALSSAITILAHERLKLVISAEAFPLPARLGHAAVSYVRYLGKVIWPGQLAVYYPPPPSVQWGELILAGLVLGAISALAVWRARRRPYLLVGWLWFLGTLVPMIGLLQVAFQSMADRFAYVPVIGLFILVTWGTAGLASGWRWRRAVLTSLALAAVMGCAVVTSRQVRYWKNSETLFAHALSVTADNAVARHNLGHALMMRTNVGEAIVHFAEAVRLEPRNPGSHCVWGNCLELQGKPGEALAHYTQALKIDPEYAYAHFNLGRVFVLQGKLEEAQIHFLEAIRLKPDYAEARCNLGNLLVIRGRLDEALWQYREALRISPNHAEGHYYLAGALARQKKMAEAIAHFETALRLRPRYAPAANDLAWILATETNTVIRNVDEAIRLAGQACEWTTNQEPLYLDTLAAACAESGRFAEAVATAQQAVSAARSAGDAPLAARLADRLESYRQRSPAGNPMPPLGAPDSRR